MGSSSKDLPALSSAHAGRSGKPRDASEPVARPAGARPCGGRRDRIGGTVPRRRPLARHPRADVAHRHRQRRGAACARSEGACGPRAAVGLPGRSRAHGAARSDARGREVRRSHVPLRHRRWTGQRRGPLQGRPGVDADDRPGRSGCRAKTIEKRRPGRPHRRRRPRRLVHCRAARASRHRRAHRRSLVARRRQLAPALRSAQAAQPGVRQPPAVPPLPGRLSRLHTEGPARRLVRDLCAAPEAQLLDRHRIPRRHV